MAWLRQKFVERHISRKPEVEWEPHTPDMNRPDSFLGGDSLRTKSTIGTLARLIHWRDLSLIIFKRSPRRNVHALSTTLHSNELRTSGECALGLLVIFLLPVCDEMVADPKMLSFYLSINRISINLSFVVLDLCRSFCFKNCEMQEATV